MGAFNFINKNKSNKNHMKKKLILIYLEQIVCLGEKTNKKVCVCNIFMNLLKNRFNLFFITQLII